MTLVTVNALAFPPIVLAPAGGGEPLMPDSRGTVPQGNPSVASGGNGWFAVWEDSRYGNGDVFGTALSPAGEPIHPDGIPITPTFAPDRDPQIVWSGDRYLAAFVNDLGVFTSRFTPDGAHLGSNLSIPASGPNAYAPTFARGTWLAWNGDRALVAWYQWGGARGRPTISSPRMADGSQQSPPDRSLPVPTGLFAGTPTRSCSA